MRRRVSNSQAIERTVEVLRDCRDVLFVTGAGMSADSGLPTYRGIGGLYDDRATDEGIPIETALSGSTFSRSPEVTWKYLLEIEGACRGATFNRGHRVIAEMEERIERVWTLTQNVDGFHRRAGSRNVIEIHGDIHDLLCLRCGRGWTVEDYSSLDPLPRCSHCGGLVRPDVVLFGEALPEEKSSKLEAELAKGFDIVFSVGTTSVFPYIARPVLSARLAGTPTVEINPGRTEVTDLVDIKITAGAAEALEEIWRRYRPISRPPPAP